MNIRLSPTEVETGLQYWLNREVVKAPITVTDIRITKAGGSGVVVSFETKDETPAIDPSIMDK